MANYGYCCNEQHWWSAKLVTTKFDCIFCHLFGLICIQNIPIEKIALYLEWKSFESDTLKRHFFNCRNATPLLCFPPSLVDQTLNEIKSKPEPESQDVLLQICLYYIEREFNFSSDGLFTASQKTFFSEALQTEVAKYRRTDEERVSDDVDADEESDGEEPTDRHHHSYSYYSSRDDNRIQDFSFSWIAVITRITSMTDSSKPV